MHSHHLDHAVTVLHHGLYVLVQNTTYIIIITLKVADSLNLFCCRGNGNGGYVPGHFDSLYLPLSHATLHYVPQRLH